MEVHYTIMSAFKTVNYETIHRMFQRDVQKGPSTLHPSSVLTSSMTIGMDVSTIHRPYSDSITYTCTCQLFVSVCSPMQFSYMQLLCSHHHNQDTELFYHHLCYYPSSHLPPISLPAPNL